MPNLFTPIKIKEYTIKNRIVMPPMVCSGNNGKDGFVTDANVRHYEERAKSDTGLIIVEATCINPSGRLGDAQLGIWSDEMIIGLKRITDACHKHGAVVIIQIHHAGLKTPKSVSEKPMAPSDYDVNGTVAKALSLDEIHQIQADFVEAAKRAEKAGFDGIELHGAHGYLLDQFMSPLINKREDAYGGNIEKRATFAIEIIQQIKASVGKTFIIGYRMGANVPTLEDGLRAAEILEANGVDLLHVSSSIGSEALPEVPDDFPNNWIVYCGTQIKKHVHIPVIVVNGIRTPKQAERLIEQELADLVAIGRGMLADPKWADHAKEGCVMTCLECGPCRWFRNSTDCPINRKAL